MSHCKFNAAFRTNVVSVANELGLTFISTPNQVNRGTLMFHDPITDTQYSLHESGYVRRYIKSSMWGYMPMTERMKTEGMPTNGYQLNRVQLVKSGTRSNVYYRSVRILASPYEQLGIFVKSVINYRNGKGN